MRRRLPATIRLVEKQDAGLAAVVRAILALLAGFALFMTTGTILLLEVLGRSSGALHASLDATLAALVLLAGSGLRSMRKPTARRRPALR